MEEPITTENELRDRSLSLVNLLFLLGGIVVIFLSQSVRSSIPEPERWKTYITAAVGFLLALLSILSLEKEKFASRFAAVYFKICDWFRLTPARMIAVIFGVIFAFVGSISTGMEFMLYSPLVSLGMWAISIGLFIYAGWTTDLRKVRFPVWPVVLSLVFFVGAFAIRAFDTTNIPIYLTGDEASGGLSAFVFTDGLTNNIFNLGWYSFPSLFFFIESIFIRILGATTPALRIVSALGGALTVGVLVLVVRQMFGMRAAVIAGLCLLFSHYHIHFSRLGLNNIWDGLGFVVTAGAFWYAWKAEKKSAFVLTGLAVGFSQYFYTTSKGLVILIGLWLFIKLFTDRKKLFRLLPDLILMVLAACVVVLPLAFYYFKYPHALMEPANRVSVLGDWLPNAVRDRGLPAWRIILEQASTALLAFTDVPLRYWYTPGVPALRENLAWAFYMGMVFLLFRIKDDRTWMVLIWLFIFFLAGAASDSPPAAQRYVASIPVCMIIVAVGIDRIAELITKSWPHWRKLTTALVLTVVVLLAVDDSRFYYFEYTRESQSSVENSAITQHLADYLAYTSPEWEVQFYGAPYMGYYSISNLPYLVRWINGVDANQPWGDPGNPAPGSKKMIFVFTGVHTEDFVACKTQYPGGKEVTELNPTGQLLYYLYQVELP